MKERYDVTKNVLDFQKKPGKTIMMTLLLEKFKKDFSKENHKTY